MLHTVAEPSNQSTQSILGMERRLERDERHGDDTTIARLVLMRHYAAYARTMVQKSGGSLTEMNALTDRDNMIPLGWDGGRCPSID